MSMAAIVPARCGSKGFPDKNIAKIGSKTLLELAVRVGKDALCVDDVFVSTDCKKYEAIAKAAGARSLGLRPSALATDDAKSVDAVIDLIERMPYRYDYLVLLQPTSPVRTPKDIESMFNMMIDKKADAAVSVCKVEDPHPYKLKSIGESGFVEPFMKGTTSEVARQTLPEVYALNGALYMIKTDILLRERSFFPEKTIAYRMEHRFNIDTKEDWMVLDAMHEKGYVEIWGAHDLEV